MRLKPEQLASQLDRDLAPIYLVSGDEPLQMMEAADSVRARARALGHVDRQVLHVEAGFDWNALLAATNSLSLFSEKRIFELRMPSGKPGQEGARALTTYAERPAEDTVLLISSARLDASALKAKWVQNIDRAGVVVQVWPVEPGQLRGWVARRLAARGLRPDPDAAQLLAERVEGNLLAAVQEIEKLALLHGKGPVTAQDVAAAVVDSARFSVFALVDSALSGDMRHTVRVLQGLRSEGIRPIQLLGLLVFEIRRLCALSTELGAGQTPEQLFARHRIWGQRKATFQIGLRRHSPDAWRRLLSRCAKADLVLKGMARGESWDELLGLCVAMAAGGGSAAECRHGGRRHNAPC